MVIGTGICLRIEKFIVPQIGKVLSDIFRTQIFNTMFAKVWPLDSVLRQMSPLHNFTYLFLLDTL
jgi:hypothetical protein